jgi:predicted nucleic acid-binding Zn ribbon protein
MSPAHQRRSNRTYQTQSLSAVLDQLLDQTKMRGKIDGVRVVEAWAELAGPPICAVTHSAKLQSDVLHVRIQSSAWRHALHMERGRWCDRLNAHLGESIVREIVFR